MKIKELIQTNAEALHEVIDKVNDTGVKTDDLVKIAEAQAADQWVQHDSLDDLIKHLEALEQ